MVQCAGDNNRLFAVLDDSGELAVMKTHTSETDINIPPLKEDTRSGLLQAALEGFATHGFGSATIRGIAARAGLSHGMIRYHYKTKRQLWLATVEFLFDRLRYELRYTPEEIADNEGDSLALFRIWLRKYVHYSARHPEHAQIMVQESVAPTDRLEQVIKEHLQEGHAIVRSQIEGYIRAGMFPAGAQPESIIYIITGACQNIFTLAPEAQLSFGYDPLTPEAIEAHADAVVAIFCPEPEER